MHKGLLCSSSSIKKEEKKEKIYLVCAELHNDVDIFFVLENVFELHHMLVSERLVDLDLCLKLLPQTSSSHYQSNTLTLHRGREAECEEAQ